VADDDLTHGEIARTLRRIEREQYAAQRAVDDRITKLAADMVPTSLWASEHRSLKEDVDDVKKDMDAGFARIEAAATERHKATGREIAALKTDIKAIREEREKKTAATWQITIALIAALAAVALVIEGVIQSGGH
jgi:hypothetical protein